MNHDAETLDQITIPGTSLARARKIYALRCELSEMVNLAAAGHEWAASQVPHIKRRILCLEAGRDR